MTRVVNRYGKDQPCIPSSFVSKYVKHFFKRISVKSDLKVPLEGFVRSKMIYT